MKKIVTLLVLPLVVIAGLIIWYREGLLPVDKNATTNEIFIIHPGEGVATIAKNLESEEFIRDRVVFYLVVKQLGIEKSIQAGDFRLNRSMSTTEIANELTHGTIDVWVTVIEGLRKEEIAEAVAKKIPISTQRFDLLVEEGYLYPDTYLIPKEASEEVVTDLLKKTFNERVVPLYEQSVMKNDYSLHEVLTLASLVEREARTPEDKRMVAGILLNRLELDMPLQIDATIQYALGYDEQGKRWWKEHLTDADLKLDSPYNTYLNPGLPPGPIANPGLDALRAVLDPQESDYLYYISGADGTTMYYAQDYETHQDNIERYLNR